MRNSDYKFVETDVAEIEALLISAYEQMTGKAVQPASPERLFIAWVANVVIYERVLANYIGNQNIPSRASGANLDALGELFFSSQRPAAHPATVTERFTISASQLSAILVPAGTRVTDLQSKLTWETVEDAYIAIGDTTVDVPMRCQTPGEIGNGYVPGQITQIVDIFPYFESCTNITTSGSGSDEATDDQFYELLRASNDAYSTAGPRGAYIYHAKSVSTNIADVKAVRRTDEDGHVDLYVLMDDGTIAGSEVKNAVLAACNDDSVRPLTDYVSVLDPDTETYNITFTYYISRDSAIASAEIQANVAKAVEEYKKWQCERLGRDINPDHLIKLLMEAGVKRIVLTAPTFTTLKDGSDGSTPQIATVGTVTVTNGGAEDE